MKMFIQNKHEELIFRKQKYNKAVNLWNNGK